MATRTDAGKLLKLLDAQFNQGTEWVNAVTVMELTQWVPGRINRAVDYLADCGAIQVNRTMGNTRGVRNFGISGLTALAELKWLRTPMEQRILLALA